MMINLVFFLNYLEMLKKFCDYGDIGGSIFGVFSILISEYIQCFE